MFNPGESLRSAQIPIPIYGHIVTILGSLPQNYDDAFIEFVEYTSSIRVEELLDIILLRSKNKTNSTVIIPLTGHEAADILRACWNAKFLYPHIDGNKAFGLSCREFRSVLNEIASVLCVFAEF